MPRPKTYDEDAPALTESVFNEIVSTNRKQGLEFDSMAIVRGETVEFYLKGKRVKAVHVLGVNSFKPPRKERKKR